MGTVRIRLQGQELALRQRGYRTLDEDENCAAAYRLHQLRAKEIQQVDATWLAELLSLRFESKGVAVSEHGTYKSGKGYVLEEWDEVASRLGRQAEHGSR